MSWYEERKSSSSEDEFGESYCDEGNERSDYDPEHVKCVNLKKLARLKSMREKVNLKNEDERYPFLRKLFSLQKHWKGEHPDLQDIFQNEEIEGLLEDAVHYQGGRVDRYKGELFIHFVARTGYKHEPYFNKYGEPFLRITTPVHLAKSVFPDRNEYTVGNLFQIYNRYDVNYTNDDGLTHFHVACKFNCYDVVEKFLDLGQNPNIVMKETGASPLHLALNGGHKKVVELLLKNGADPNLANKYGSTPLHIICEIDNIDDTLIDEDTSEYVDEYRDLAELFFKVNDEMQQTVKIDARDKCDQTPLQRAVAHLKPELIDLLLDRGADLPSFVFTDKYNFGQCSQRHKESWPHFKLRKAFSILITVERLEKRGYELERSDAQTIIAFFVNCDVLGESEQLEKCWYEDEMFTWAAKKMMIKPNLSLYDVVRLRFEEAAKLLTTYKDYVKFASADETWYFPGTVSRGCEFHPLEIMLRIFCRRWSLEPFMELTCNRLPILCCEMILDQLMNRDLCNIFLAFAVQSSPRWR